ncbi:hypothetical protein O2N63_17135 [Aliiroseovarius sp. KMU-50]|uniref:Uncharacterized protein n=1 Tax=Aliiroseovarius salicola TaxID=3009082 RepID=A0ABT4W5L8_9RHOB|nr:hypothetical protein [Aliiroseovarius sp. KMU-50]MDA5095817.1 hypothetical protein [Aliiroseovarius sp. KMU-50]
MARFKKSNETAAAQIEYMQKRKTRRPSAPEKQKSYFERIGFDAAMI